MIIFHQKPCNRIPPPMMRITQSIPFPELEKMSIYLVLSKVFWQFWSRIPIYPFFAFYRIFKKWLFRTALSGSSFRKPFPEKFQPNVSENLLFISFLGKKFSEIVQTFSKTVLSAPLHCALCGKILQSPHQGYFWGGGDPTSVEILSKFSNSIEIPNYNNSIKNKNSRRLILKLP